MMVRYEDGKWINNIGVYFEILKKINEDLLKLINYKYNHPEKIKLIFFDISVNLNRIIPMKYKKISYDDGILKLKEYFDFLEKDYDSLYNVYKDDLITIKDVRNKFEHVPHIIKWRQYVGNDKEKEMLFINDEYNNAIIENNVELLEKKKKLNEKLEWEISTNSFIRIIIEINKIFEKIQYKLKEYFANNSEALNHPYIKSIININIPNYIDKLNQFMIS